MDNPIHQNELFQIYFTSINLYPVDSAIDKLTLIYWIVIYPLDSTIQRLYNGRLYFILTLLLPCIICTCLLDIACLFVYSKRLFLLHFFSHLIKHFIGRARRVQIECCIAVVHVYVAGLLEKTTISNKYRLKRLTSACVSIACESCFTGACVGSHIIATHRINVTAVRVGRALVDV